jgi:hypothetical protein
LSFLKKPIKILAMKKLIIPCLFITLISSCGNSDDSKKAAVEDNKEKFDTSAGSAVG